MKKIKHILYATYSTVLFSVPMIVGAQWQPTVPAGSNLPTATFGTIIQTIINWLLMLVGFLGIIGFIVAGILYLTAAGDEGQIDKAKSTMIFSIVGVVVALLGYVVLNVIRSWLSGGGSAF